MTAVEVTHLYEAVADDELTIKPGMVLRDCIPVEGEIGWMSGVLNGKKGLFPDNFVRVLNTGSEGNAKSVAAARLSLSPVNVTPDEDNEYDMAIGERNAQEVKLIDKDFSIVSDFKAVKAGQLSLKKGGKVKVMRTEEDGWFFGEFKNEKGTFPASCVSESDAVGQTIKQSPKQNSNQKTSKPVASADGESAVVMTSSSGEKKFVVKHKYEAAQKDELTLKPGEIVVLVEDVEPGWAHGKLVSNGKTGLYPTNFVVAFDESPKSASARSSKKSDSSSKHTSKKESDQHKQDLRVDPSDDELDGGAVLVGSAKDIPSSNSGKNLNKSKSASQSSLDDILDDTSSPQGDSRKAEGKKRRGITSAVKRHAQKVLPISHKHHQSDISVDVNSSAKSSLKTSQSGEHISPTSHSAAGTPTGNQAPIGVHSTKTGGRLKPSSKMNKSMESVNSVDDEHENVSRGSASSNELLAEIGTPGQIGSTSADGSVVVSPVEPGVLLLDNMFPAIEIDAMPTMTPSNAAPKPNLGVTRKGVPRPNNKRLPTKSKLKQDAEKAESDRAQAAEKAAVILTKEESAASKSPTGDSSLDPVPEDSRVKVGPPFGGPGVGNRFGGVPFPGGANLLSELRNKQNKHTPESSLPLISPQPSTLAAAKNPPSAAATGGAKTPSSAFENRKSVFGGASGAPTKPFKPLVASRPQSTLTPPTTQTSLSASATATPPVSHNNNHPSPSPSQNQASSPYSHRPQSSVLNHSPTNHTSAHSSSNQNPAFAYSHSTNHNSATVSTTAFVTSSQSSTVNMVANAPPGMAAKPTRPPPPQVPEKPRDFSASGAFNNIAVKQSKTEVELRTVKDTVTRLERRIKELEGQLEQEQEARKRLEAKVDALVKAK
ncbi:SH3 domain-containing kinase-binding protein 1-like isoform X3 [Symsagittifera roscoffensis]|uniref:SH3 domain-containing kinase-binding protein 1-like isoform X3 n=1 Tax=Symsagittifera roscoffensis TaxID=84072 RepID=UPI00307BEFB3